MKILAATSRISNWRQVHCTKNKYYRKSPRPSPKHRKIINRWKSLTKYIHLSNIWFLLNHCSTAFIDNSFAEPAARIFSFNRVKWKDGALFINFLIILKPLILCDWVGIWCIDGTAQRIVCIFCRCQFIRWC